MASVSYKEHSEASWRTRKYFLCLSLASCCAESTYDPCCFLRTCRCRLPDPFAAEGSAKKVAGTASRGGGFFGSSPWRKRKSSSKTRKSVSGSHRSSIMNGNAMS